MKTYFTLNICKKKSNKLITETVNPVMDNHNFDITVDSPTKLHYTEIFWDYSLGIEKAWDLYQKLFERQVQDVKTEKDILEKFQAHFPTLELQFKYIYGNKMYEEIGRSRNIEEIETPKPPEEIKNEIEEIKKNILNKKLK